MIEKQIVVLTPVKNEAWILNQFLTVTSSFADCIIIADQYSTDRSKEIANKFEKVNWVVNDSSDYSEAYRQKLLIAEAKKRFGNSAILFALDADEILTLGSLESKEWQDIKNLPAGSSIFFEKPDILRNGNCVRWEQNYFNLGYVDDGKEHLPKEIHSRRLPFNAEKVPVMISSIKFMHFGHFRPNVTSSKTRYYSVLECIIGTKTFYQRRAVYPCFYKEGHYFKPNQKTEDSQVWLSEWEGLGINFRNIEDPVYNWYDLEVLKLFKKHGTEKFYNEDIWDFDWNTAVEYFTIMGLGLELPEKVVYPSGIRKKILQLSDFGYNKLKRKNK